MCVRFLLMVWLRPLASLGFTDTWRGCCRHPSGCAEEGCRVIRMQQKYFFWKNFPMFSAGNVEKWHLLHRFLYARINSCSGLSTSSEPEVREGLEENPNNGRSLRMHKYIWLTQLTRRAVKYLDSQQSCSPSYISSGLHLEPVFCIFLWQRLGWCRNGTRSLGVWDHQALSPARGGDGGRGEIVNCGLLTPCRWAGSWSY